MNFNIRYFLIAVIMIAGVGSTIAKIKISDGFYLNAEFRPRLEFDNRDFLSESGYDSYATYRTRIGLGLVNIIENTELYIMMGDSRMMGYTNPYLTGEPPGPNKFDNNLGVVKAYIRINKIFDKDLYLKIGRMSNDQGRFIIFGPGNWNFCGPRTYDGIKIGYYNDGLSMNLWNLYGANGDRHWYPLEDDPASCPNPSIDYKRDHTLTGLDLSIWDNKFNFLMFMDLDQEPVLDTLSDKSNIAFNRITSAINIQIPKNDLRHYRIDIDIAYQFGSMAHEEGNGVISGYLFAGDYVRDIVESGNAWVGAGFHIISGDDGKNPDRITYFYDKYCSKHRFLGHMDYFTSDTGIKSQGIRDLIFRLGFKPLEKMSIDFDIHNFSVEKPIVSFADGKAAYNLGQEIDTTVKYSIRKGIQYKLGIDFFIPSDDWKGTDSDLSTFIFMELSKKI